MLSSTMSTLFLRQFVDWCLAAAAVGLRAGCLGEAENRGCLQCPQLDSMAEVLNVSAEGGCGCHLA